MSVFFCNDTATTEIYTLSLHDALPISPPPTCNPRTSETPASPPAYPATPARTAAPRTSHAPTNPPSASPTAASPRSAERRSEEHTSELQSRQYLVCRLLLEKKNTHRRA